MTCLMPPPHCGDMAVIAQAAGCWVNPPDARVRRLRPPVRRDLVHESLALVDGVVPVPDRPGIGVTVDCEVLDRYAIA